MPRRPRSDAKYRVENGEVVQVVGRGAVVVYDFLDPGEAEIICDLLNAGHGPDWDDLAPLVERAKRAAGKPQGRAR